MKHEVIYGGLGCGKSSFVHSIVTPEETFKLGVGGRIREALLLKFGSKHRHEEENRLKGIEHASTTLNTVIEDVSSITKPLFVLDEWTSFFSYSFWWSDQRIKDRANGILDAVENNPCIERAIYVALDYIPYLPLNAYKKKAAWNKALFQRADVITRVDFGIPISSVSKGGYNPVWMGRYGRVHTNTSRQVES